MSHELGKDYAAILYSLPVANFFLGNEFQSLDVRESILNIQLDLSILDENKIIQSFFRTL